MSYGWNGQERGQATEDGEAFDAEDVDAEEAAALNRMRSRAGYVSPLWLPKKKSDPRKRDEFGAGWIVAYLAACLLGGILIQFFLSENSALYARTFHLLRLSFPFVLLGMFVLALVMRRIIDLATAPVGFLATATAITSFELVISVAAERLTLVGAVPAIDLLACLALSVLLGFHAAVLLIVTHSSKMRRRMFGWFALTFPAGVWVILQRYVTVGATPIGEPADIALAARLITTIGQAMVLLVALVLTGRPDTE